MGNQWMDDGRINGFKRFHDRYTGNFAGVHVLKRAPATFCFLASVPFLMHLLRSHDLKKMGDLLQLRVACLF